MPIRNRFAELNAEITAWRHDFHEHPELQYDVHRTAGIVAEKLKEFGCDEVTTGIGKTGVVGVIKGKSNASGRTIGLRADMDALPIKEATGLAYASKTPGKMHACGHDGHTSILLGAAKYLSETRNFDGDVVLIFQPAEEGGAGALAMCQDGLMDRWKIGEVYALHNAPGLPVGCFAIRPGPVLASSDNFQIVLTGKGGHAAEPHQAIDITLVAAHVLVALQTIVSRTMNPVDRTVLTVGTLETDSDADNIIAHQVKMAGTLRTLEPENRMLAKSRIFAIAENTALAFDAKAEIIWSEGYPVTINHDAETGHAIDAAKAVSDDVDENVDPIMPSEDFAYMLEERPGAYIHLGNGDSAQCHHPAYDFNDDAIPVGCSWFVELVEQRLKL